MWAQSTIESSLNGGAISWENWLVRGLCFHPQWSESLSLADQHMCLWRWFSIRTEPPLWYCKPRDEPEVITNPESCFIVQACGLYLPDSSIFFAEFPNVYSCQCSAAFFKILQVNFVFPFFFPSACLHCEFLAPLTTSSSLSKPAIFRLHRLFLLPSF